MSFSTINPVTGQIIKEYEEFSFDDIDRIIKQSHNAFLGWKRTSFAERSELMQNATNILRENKNQYGELMALEMGKPLAQGIAEAEKCAWVCEHYAENAEWHLSDEIIKTEMAKSYVSFKPLGVVLAIMPWNFPFWQVTFMGPLDEIPKNL